MKPSSVLTDVSSSSRMRSSCSWVIASEFTQSDCTRGRARRRRAVRYDSSWIPAASTPESCCWSVGQPLLERGGDVDVPVELVDERHRDLVLDVLVRDQLFGRAAEGVRVERLVPDESGEEPDRRQQREDDDEDPGGQHLAPGWGHAESPSFCSHTAAFRNAPATMRRAIR